MPEDKKPAPQNVWPVTRECSKCHKLQDSPTAVACQYCKEPLHLGVLPEETVTVEAAEGPLNIPMDYCCCCMAPAETKRAAYVQRRSIAAASTLYFFPYCRPCMKRGGAWRWNVALAAAAGVLFLIATNAYGSPRPGLAVAVGVAVLIVMRPRRGPTCSAEIDAVLIKPHPFSKNMMLHFSHGVYGRLFRKANDCFDSPHPEGPYSLF